MHKFSQMEQLLRCVQEEEARRQNNAARKITMNDIFGVSETERNIIYAKKDSRDSKIADFRKQGEYGEKKFIKP